MRPNLERIGTIIIHATTTAPCVVLAIDLDVADRESTNPKRTSTAR
jgi:hypothetical protein